MSSARRVWKSFSPMSFRMLSHWRVYFFGDVLCCLALCGGHLCVIESTWDEGN